LIGRPVVVAAKGEVRRIAETERIAETLDPGDPRALAAAISRLRDNVALRSELASAARSFAARNLRERGVERLEELLRSVAR
jgi:glycosyltransferase involved in cell wall biosynthesis